MSREYSKAEWRDLLENRSYDDPPSGDMSDTPRTDFVAHESDDPEWNRFPNRFARMMAHACILERELAEMQRLVSSQGIRLMAAEYGIESARQMERPDVIPSLKYIAKKAYDAGHWNSTIDTIEETITELERLRATVTALKDENAHLRAMNPGSDAKPPAYKYPETFCSQCGGEFGPGNEGFSHCRNHAHLARLG